MLGDGCSAATPSRRPLPSLSSWAGPHWPTASHRRLVTASPDHPLELVHSRAGLGEPHRSPDVVSRVYSCLPSRGMAKTDVRSAGLSVILMDVQATPSVAHPHAHHAQTWTQHHVRARSDSRSFSRTSQIGSRSCRPLARPPAPRRHRQTVARLPSRLSYSSSFS